MAYTEAGLSARAWPKCRHRVQPPHACIRAESYEQCRLKSREAILRLVLPVGRP